MGRLAVSVDAGVYLAALILTLVSGLLFGMIPARQVWQSSPLQAMKSGPVDVNAPAPVVPAGPAARRTDCHLHAAGHRLIRRGARYGAHAARAAGIPAAGRNGGRHGP